MQIRNDESGGAVWVVKAASSDAEARHLRHETAQLRRAAHPGVVEIGRLRDDDVVELWTREAGRSLAEQGPLAAAELAGLGAAVATLLADLHDLGVVHGSVHDGHILVGADGRPVLCGFGRSGSVGDLDPADDVVDLMTTLAQRLPPEAPRRLQRVLRPPRGRPLAARSLATALARAVPERRLPPAGPSSRKAVGDEPGAGTAPDWDRRHLERGADPIATARAESERGVAPLAGDVGRPRPAPSIEVGRHRPAEGPRRHLPRRRTAIVVVGAVVALLVATLGLHLSGARHAPAASTSCPSQDDGCRPVAVHDGQFSTADGRFAVAMVDPVVVVGRWDCGPAGLPAALDRRSGRVWAWSAWAGTVGKVTATAVATRPGARSLRVVPAKDACDRLEVVGPGRSSAVLSPGGGPHA